MLRGIQSNHAPRALDIWSFAKLTKGDARVEYVVVSNGCEIVSEPFGTKIEALMHLNQIRINPETTIEQFADTRRRENLIEMEVRGKPRGRNGGRRRAA